MIPFSIISPSQLDFGSGKVAIIPDIVKALGTSEKILVLSDKGVAGTGVPAKTSESLEDRGYSVLLVDTVPPERSMNWTKSPPA